MAVPSEELPRLGRYQVINKIAAGGMAEVFLAKATGAMGFQRLVAVKLIHANFTRDEDFVKMFIDEARIAMHLHHRNIVQVFDLDKAGDTYFIAMEFVHGVNLYDLYERIASQNRWIEPSMALYLVAEISKGLHFAHTRAGSDGRPLGIVHRDISPQNVLLSFEGEVKITDFGIATAAERLHQTAAGIVKGKYAYMAPERLQELPTDGRVDVFSVGVLLYELLVGENPFAGASAVETIENVLSKPVPPPSSRGAPVAPPLDRICLKALARDRDERYATAQDLADAVTEYALELTQARRDMAAGDASVAALLAELFPEKAKRPLVGSEAGAVSLPLANDRGIAVATLDPKPAHANGASKNGVEPHEISRSNPTFPDPADSRDLDEPTLLRMKPPGGEFESGETTRGSSLDRETERSTPAGSPEPRIGDVTAETPISSLAPGEADRTAPTQLPFTPPVRKPAGRTPPEPTYPRHHDAFAATMPDDPHQNAIAARPISSSMVPSTVRAAPYQAHAQVLSAHGTADPRLQGGMSASTSIPLSGINTPPAGRSGLVIVAALLAVASVAALAAVLIIRRHPAAIPVSISVTSTPPGARVYMDGQMQEQVTPFHTAVFTGEQHTFWATIPGKPEVPTQTVNPDTSAPISLHFDLGPSTGTITVDPTPSTARVELDGNFRGTGRQEMKEIPLDREVMIRVQAPGFKTSEQRVRLTSDLTEITVPMALTPAEPPAEVKKRSIYLYTKPNRKVEVLLGDRSLGTTPMRALLPVGEVDLQLRSRELNLNKVIKVQVGSDGGRLEIPLP